MRSPTDRIGLDIVDPEPVRPTGSGDAAPTQRPPVPEPAEPATADSERRSFRGRFRRVGADGSGRTFGLAALLASMLAALIVGGLGGAGLHAAFDGDRGDRGDRGDWMSERHGPGEGGDRHGGSGPGMPGSPGQVPPTTAPEDDSDG